METRRQVDGPAKVEVWVFIFEQVKPEAKTRDLGLSLRGLDFYQRFGITGFVAVKVLQTGEEEVDLFLGFALAWSKRSIGKGPLVVQGVMSAGYLVRLVGRSFGAVR